MYTPLFFRHFIDHLILNIVKNICFRTMLYIQGGPELSLHFYRGRRGAYLLLHLVHVPGYTTLHLVTYAKIILAHPVLYIPGRAVL